MAKKKTDDTSVSLADITDTAELRKIIYEQNEYIEQLSDAALMYGIVVGHDEPGFCAVSVGGKVVRVHNTADYKTGDEVHCHPQSMQILSRSPRKTSGGVAVLNRALDGDRWEVEMEGGVGTRIISKAEGLTKEAKGGDIVLMDGSGMIFTEILERGEDEQFGIGDTHITWDDIGGQKQAKEELRDAISQIRGGDAATARYQIKPPKGFLFAGPPGCGKTMLGKAAATEMAKDAKGAFMYVKGPEILAKYVGVAEGRIRGLFAAAKQHKDKYGTTPILFIDEADAILQKRGTGVSSDMEKTIVTTFLTEMDGINDSSVFVILASNRPETLDEAVIRDGRIDRRLTIERPGPDQLKEIFILNLKNLPLTKEHSAEELADFATDSLMSSGKLVSQLSGALVVAIVERAKRHAIRRDAASDQVSGVCRADLTKSIMDATKEVIA